MPATDRSAYEQQFQKISNVLAVLPPDRWTSYGVLAELTGMIARNVGRFMTDARLKNAYQVLQKDGKIAEAFRWSDPNRTDDPRAVLERQGIVFNASGKASPDQFFGVGDFRRLLGVSDDPGELHEASTEKHEEQVYASPRLASDLSDPSEEDIEAFERYLESREDLNDHGKNKRLLLAAELILDIEDIRSVAVEALVDGSNDKSCDLLYVDRDSGLILLAQSYESNRPEKSEAPANKAASLHQAVTWIFGQGLEVPERIRPAVEQARDALNDGAIREIRLWFVHNLPESKNVAEELHAVASSTKAALNPFHPPGGGLLVTA